MKNTDYMQYETERNGFLVRFQFPSHPENEDTILEEAKQVLAILLQEQIAKLQ